MRKFSFGENNTPKLILGKKIPLQDPFFREFLDCFSQIWKKMEIFGLILLKLKRFREFLHKFSNHIHFYIKKQRIRKFFGEENTPHP